jgi:transposase
MALGRRGPKQVGMWVATSNLPSSPGHSFYEKLNKLLGEAEFDRRVEKLCAPYYAEDFGRPGIPPGVYFRMLLVGYFEGLGAQRAIAWKCADSLSVRAFLGLEISEEAPEHSSLTRIRKRLPLAVHSAVFSMVLEIAREKGMLKGKTIAVDATMLEANAAMKTMVRRVSGEDWKAYLRRLAKEAGIEDPSDEELRRFDRKRKDKKVSNNEWKSPTDPEARIAKMKDGRTHFAYKAEHAVDVDSDVMVAAEIYQADEADTETVLATVTTAREQLEAVECERTVEEVLGDKGYHKAETIMLLEDPLGVRTYIPERESKNNRVWTDKEPGLKESVYRNRRRYRGARGRQLSRKRSEYAERTMAHVCETGGARRTWLRGLQDVAKRYWVTIAARNLGVIMRAVCGIGTPRSLQPGLVEAFFRLLRLVQALQAALCRPQRHFSDRFPVMSTFSARRFSSALLAA